MGDIASRFVVTAMSLGALSPEAYRALAIGMNRVGGRSNSGEGGEDPNWYDEAGPDEPHSKIKQVASGRFGVTARYLAKASELEIKMAQGSKPGEGGQLPGHKVTEFIAGYATRFRAAADLAAASSRHLFDRGPGSADLRPAPGEPASHHRRQAGRRGRGWHDRGRGRQGTRRLHPDQRSHRRHRRQPIGVDQARRLPLGARAGRNAADARHERPALSRAAAHRRRIKTRKMSSWPRCSAREEYGFGTSVLIAIGCDMARQCHLNSCPTGIATQKEELRAKFAGTPGWSPTISPCLPEGVREVLAALGARTIDEIVGRTDLLAAKRTDLTGRAGMLEFDRSSPSQPPKRCAEAR